MYKRRLEDAKEVSIVTKESGPEARLPMRRKCKGWLDKCCFGEGEEVELK